MVGGMEVGAVPGGVVTSIGLRLAEGVPIRLRGSLDATAFLTIGDGIEIILGRSHVRALREQSVRALGDMASIEAADDVVSAAFDAGAQARTAAVRALEQADAAERAGAGVQADRAREAARIATSAAEHAQQAVEAASAAMVSAEEAAEDASQAAVDAAKSASVATSGRSTQRPA